MTRRIYREKPIFILICITVLYFYRPIFLGEVFYFRDLYAHFVPTKKLVAEIISKNELPLWNPYLQGGSPLLGNPNNMVLYPTNLLYLWIPAHRALTLEIVLHLLAGILAVYVFCRLIRLDQTSSFIAAVLYGFSGYAFSTLNFLNWLTASAYLPILFCFWHLYILEKKKKWWILCVCAASLQFFAGAPEITIISFATMILWTLFYPYPLPVSRKLIQWIILGVFTAGICSVLLLPSMELSRVSIRSFGFGFETSTAWSIHPYRLAELFFPRVLGDFSSISPGAYWGLKLEGANSYFLSIYFGITAWMLAIVGGFSSEKHEGFPPRIRKTCIILILLILLLSTGRYIPGMQNLFNIFSLRLPFRYPVKLLAAVIFPFCVLAAFGSRAILNRDKNTSFVFWGISILLIFLLAIFYFSPSLNAAIANDVFAQPLSQQMQKTWLHAILHAFLIWTAVCLILQTRFQWKHAALAALVALDVLLAGIPYKIFGSPDLYTREPKIASLIRSNIDSGKFFRTSGDEPERLNPSGNDMFLRVMTHQQTLAGHLASNFAIPVIFHDDQDGSSLLSINYLRLVIGNLPWREKLPLLNAANVRLILTPEQLNVPGLTPVPLNHSVLPQPFYLYLNEETPGSPEFVHRWLPSQSAQETLKKMISPNFHQEGGVVLQTQMEPKTLTCTASQIMRKRKTFRTAVYQVKSECLGFVVFADPAYPGWHVKVDGSEAPQIPANFIYSATFVERGTHEVEKIYSPGTVKTGALISLLTVFCMLVIPFRFINS